MSGSTTMATVGQHLRRMSGGLEPLTRGSRSFSVRDFREELQNGDELWQGLQKVLVTLFQTPAGERLPKIDMTEVNAWCRSLLNSELKNEITTRFEENLLIKCLSCIRDTLMAESEAHFLDKLAQSWSHFYQKIVPVVCMAFLPVPTFGMTIRQLCLKGYRDVVLLKVLSRVKSSLGDDDGIPIEIVQMLLTVQSVPVTSSETYRQTEEIAGLIIRPYLQNMRAIGTQLEQEFNDN